MSEADAVLRKVWNVALKKEQLPSGTGNNEPVVLLEALATDMESEHMGEATASLLLNKDNLDRMVVSRLIQNPPEQYSLTPLQYLMRCYERAAEQSRSSGMANKPELMEAVQTCRELIINYAGLVLMGGIIPHIGPVATLAEQRGGPLQLLDALDARLGVRMSISGGGSSPAAAQVALPVGFLEDLSSKWEAEMNLEGLQQLVTPVAKELARRARGCTALGDYTAPLAGMRVLVGMEAVARALVGVREFLPNLKDITGRGIESPGSSWLGPCFCPSALDDPLIKAQPNIGQQCFHDPDHSRRAADKQQSMRTLQLASKQIRGELTAIIKVLLGKSTREAAIKWLAGSIEGNSERGKMQWSVEKGASHGFFLNHNAVMLALSAPFLESPNFWKRVDVRYVAINPRLDFSDDTKLAATHSEDSAHRQQVLQEAAAANGGQATANGGGCPIEYHFICECFFMTLKSLHYGLVKMLDDLTVIQQNMHWVERDLREAQAEVDRLQGTPMAMAGSLHLQAAKAKLSAMQSAAACMVTVLQDSDFMGEVLAFYRLVACWLLSVANPSYLSPGSQGPLPLPEQPSPHWTCLPEWFLEDIVDVLLMVSRVYPPLLMNIKVDEVMLLMLATMDQPKYVRSNHMRAKMAELLHTWLPEDDMQMQGRMHRSRPRGQLASTVSHLFQGHPLVVARLVPSLVRLYVDVEAMDVRNNFYEKFRYRQYIGEILAHLWELPAHREAWRKFAREEGSGSAAYVRFANMLITDATYLLDESLKKVEEIRVASNKLADPTTVAGMTPQEQQELQGSLDQAGGHLQALLSHAQATMAILNFSTEEVCATFLLPEMVDRTAGMLNYFMSLLTGPKRKKLALKEPEKYNFRPRELLQNLLQVYLHLAAADRSGVLYRAIAGDMRSYSPAMFAEAARVLAAAGMLSPVNAAQLDALDAGVQRAAAEAAEQEDLLQGVDVPDEFQDPIMADLMTEPVLLPTSNTIMDKAHITRHLLTDQRDPLSRAPLTPDMLVPQPELQARIQAWISETKAAKLAERQRLREQQ